MSNDPRSNRGILSRGFALYPDGSPNPKGKNQHKGKAKMLTPQELALQDLNRTSTNKKYVERIIRGIHNSTH